MPLPGMPTVLVTRPLLFTPARAPLTAADSPTNFVLTDMRMPGAIKDDLRALKPIWSPRLRDVEAIAWAVNGANDSCAMC